MKMTKKKIERILTRKMKRIRKLWLKYIDSLPEEGNEKQKETGYLTMCIFRRHFWFNSFLEEGAIRGKDKVDCTVSFKEEK